MSFYVNEVFETALEGHLTLRARATFPHNKHHKLSDFYCYRSSRPEVFYKKVFLKISKMRDKTPALDSCFNTVAGLGSATLLKKWLGHRCFPVNFAKFFENSFFI